MLKLRPASFKFDKIVEKEFKENYFGVSIRQIRVSFLLLIGLYCLFSLVDYLYTPLNFKTFFQIRYLLVAPLFITVYFLTYFKFFIKVWQCFLVIAFITAGSGIAIMLVKLNNDIMYIMGMMLVFTAGFSLIRLRFFWGTVAGWITLIIYNILIIKFTEESYTNLITINSFLVSNIVIGMIISYFQEFELRKNFILRRELQEKSTIIESVNDILAERVEGKTKQLNERNKELLLEIEHRKEIEQELLIAKDKAEGANRLKSTFLANMSHEIRTPLNAIIGFSEILLSEVENPEHKQFTHSISQAGKSLLDIINDILDYSYMESGRFQTKKVPERLQELFDDLKTVFWQSAKKKNIELMFKCDEKFPAVLLDVSHFRQILINLIGNAIKFTESGYIKVESTCLGKPRKGTCNLLISVEDTGTGISEEDLKKIFNPFEQGENSSSFSEKGTGLGLSISKKIIEELGGSIRVESEVGKGTTFYVELPQVPFVGNEMIIPEKSNQDSRFWDFGGKTVLIVDDIAINRKVLAKQLEKMNLNVTASGSGAEALEIVLTKSFDLFIFDLRMPNMDGEQLAQSIRAIQSIRKSPIICITASMNPEEKYKLHNFDEILFKPSSFAQIAETVEKVLRSTDET
ncbi:MAG: response regulator [Candidatus Cloacimonetes bacterium]|nr:response regulator [Candidatus Cloacimonadota bacterium]